MKASHLLLCVALGLLAGCHKDNQRDNDSTVTTNPRVDEPSLVRGSHNSQSRLSATDTDFLNKAAVGNMKEVAMGRIAVRQGAMQEVRDFGQKLIDDHSRMLEDVKTTARNKGVDVPTAIPADEQQKMDAEHFQRESGHEFDKDFVRAMISDHEKDLDAFQREAHSGMDSQVRELASRSLPTIQEHLRMARDMMTKMDSPSIGTMPHERTNDNMPMTPRVPPDQPPVPSTPDNPSPMPSSPPQTPPTPPENPR